MNFEDLEACWKADPNDDRHSRPADLKEHAVSTAAAAELTASVFEIALSVIFGFTGIVTLYDAIHDAEPWHSYPPALITLGIALFILIGRRVRRHQVDFSTSLTGMIDDGLRTVAFQIHRTKTFLWWFVIPTVVAVGINMLFNFGGRPLWVWLIQPLGVLAFYVAMLVEMKTSHIPRQRTLELLKSQFTGDADHQPS
jgi:hypothetical protein